jgi:response regulator RpfG family c-di-GMP phosphodiesterase
VTQLVPHLLLRADPGASETAPLLRSAGYMVSRIDDDTIAVEIAGSNHVDGLIVELPALAAINFVRKIEARHDQNIAVLVVTQSVDALRRALPHVRTIKTFQIEDDLISTVDLALVAHQMQRTG